MFDIFSSTVKLSGYSSMYLEWEKANDFKFSQYLWRILLKKYENSSFAEWWGGGGQVLTIELSFFVWLDCCNVNIPAVQEINHFKMDWERYVICEKF